MSKPEKPKTKKQKSQRPLTNRERKLFELVAKGKTITDAALEAGYSEKFPGQAGSRAFANIKEKAPGLFDRHGLDDDAFVEKCIKPALFATEVKVFRSEDEIVYSKPLIAWGPRVSMNRLVAEMKGLVVKEQDTPGAQIRVVVINQANRPPRIINTQPIAQVPGLGAPKGEA